MPQPPSKGAFEAGSRKNRVGERGSLNRVCLINGSINWGLAKSPSGSVGGAKRKKEVSAWGVWAHQLRPGAFFGYKPPPFESSIQPSLSCQERTRGKKSEKKGSHFYANANVCLPLPSSSAPIAFQIRRIKQYQ